MINYLKTLKEKHPLLKYLFYPAITARGFFIKKQLDIQQRLIEDLQELLVQDPLVRLPEFNGQFFLDRRSDLFKRIILNKCYEPQLSQCCRNLIDKNRDAIDIGANVGFFTVLFANILNNRKVLSIEPTKLAQTRLYKNIVLNQVKDKVIVFEGAATNRAGEIEIKTIEGKEEYSSVGAMALPCIATESFTIQKVMSTTIDELVGMHAIDPGFIKMDVEGVEHLVLAGAQNTLAKSRPIILSELSDFLLKKNGSSAIDVVNIIKSFGYNILNPINKDIPINYKNISNVQNVLCLPK